MMDSVKTVPKCPAKLPEELVRPIRELAKLWKESELCPIVSIEALKHWDALIEQWIDDKSLPLFIRRTGVGRGMWVFNPISKRDLIFTDNSPAQWVFSKAYCDEKPGLEQIHLWLKEDKIPIAMIRSISMKTGQGLKCVLASNKEVNLNKFGWKLAHIDRIGLGQKGKVEKMGASSIEQHFRKFMSPSNMFVVPKVWGGIGELTELCDLFRRLP